MMNLIIAEGNFMVEASRERVWRLIGKVIFSSLPGMEQVEILDENNFRALLRMKILWFELSLKLKGEMVDMFPPASFSVKLSLEGPSGLFKTDQRVAFAITRVENNKTAVGCKATIENMGFLPRVMLLGQARRFAQSTFAAIEKRLQDLA